MGQRDAMAYVMQTEYFIQARSSRYGDVERIGAPRRALGGNTMSGLPPGRFPTDRRAECLGPYPIWPYRQRATNGSRLIPLATERM
jgi:hypothetical protein